MKPAVKIGEVYRQKHTINNQPDSSSRWMQGGESWEGRGLMHCASWEVLQEPTQHLKDGPGAHLSQLYIKAL